MLLLKSTQFRLRESNPVFSSVSVNEILCVHQSDFPDFFQENTLSCTCNLIVYLIFFTALMLRMVRHPTAVPWMVQVHLLDWFYRTCRHAGNPSSTAPTRTSNSHLNHSPEILLSPVNCKYHYLIFLLGYFLVIFQTQKCFIM